MIWVYGVPLDQKTGHDAAHALLAWAYGRHVGGPMPELCRGPWGKPFFRGGVEFSLTHTKTMAFCALGDCPVGVDAETVRAVRPRVAGRTMNPPELTWMEDFQDRDEAFLRLWTAKEAWSKLTGHGLDGRPKDIVLTVGPGEILGVRDAAAIFQWRRAQGVLVTVCTQEPTEIRWTLLQESV